MKNRITLLILAAACAASLLTACNPAPTQGGGTAAPPIDSYDTERQFPVETEEGNTVAAGFTVKEKLYDFKGENVLIFHVSNESEQNYTLKLRITCKDENGKTVGKKAQTVRGFEAGHEKYLMFRPGRDFHAFTYTLDTVFFRGISHERNFRSPCFRVIPVHPEALPRQGSCPIRIEATEEYTGTQAIEVVCSYLLLDKDDHIYSLHTAAPRRLTQPLSAHTFTAIEHDFPAEGNIPLEEELRERGMLGLCVYTVTPIQ